MAAKATTQKGSGSPMSSHVKDCLSGILSPDAVPFTPLGQESRGELSSVAATGVQFSRCYSKLCSLRAGDPASLKTELNLLFDQLISENYTSNYCPNHNIRAEEVCSLLVHATRLVPHNQEHLVVKLCQLTHHLLNQLQVVVDEQTLDVCVNYVVRALGVCATWAHCDILLALSTLVYGNGLHCTRHLSELLGEGGVLRLYGNPSQPDMELRRAALTCLANLCLGIPGQPSLEEPYRSVCFKVFLQTLQSPPPPPNADPLLYCMVVQGALKGLQSSLSKWQFGGAEDLGSLLAVLKRFMFHGSPGVCVDWPSVLYPTPLPQYQTCTPEPTQDPPTKAKNSVNKKRKSRGRGKKTGEEEVREVGPEPQGGGETLSRTPVPTPSLYPLWKISSSDSEFSDPEGAAHSKLRLYHSRVRQGALLCLLTVVKAVDRRTLYGYWSSFIPDAPIGGPPPLTLLTIVLKDPSPKVRTCALQVLSALLEGSRQFLGVAEDLAPPRTSYTPFSFSMATTIRELHRSLSLALVAESSPHTLTQIIKCLAHLVCNAPYNRLRPGLLSTLWRQIQSYLRHRDVNVRVSVLTLYGALMSTQAPLPEIQLLLTQPDTQNTSQDTARSWRRTDGSASPSHTAQASQTPQTNSPRGSQGHTPQSSHTPRGEESRVPWLLQLCMSLVTQPRDDQSDSDCTVGGGSSALEPSPVRLEALQVLAHLVRGYFPLCQVCLCELGGVSARCLQETDPSIQLHGTKLLEELGTGIIHQYRSENCQSERCRVPIEQVVQFWVDVLSGPLNGALQSHQHPTLQTSACDTVSSILPQAFTQLPERSQALCITVLLGLTYSENSLVKAAAVRALGVYILFPCLREVKSNAVRALGNLLRFLSLGQLTRPGFERPLEEAVSALVTTVLSEATMKVRWNACYALGNAFRNPSLPLGSAAWSCSAFSALCCVVISCQNFKVRIKSAAALSIPPSRQCYGDAQRFEHVWSSLMTALKHSQETRHFLEYRYCSTLRHTITHALTHLLHLSQSHDLPALGASLETEEGRGFKGHLLKYLRGGSGGADGERGAGVEEEGEREGGVTEGEIEENEEERLRALSETLERLRTLGRDGGDGDGEVGAGQGRAAEVLVAFLEDVLTCCEEMKSTSSD
ncbi:hypothetical protein UPYG_G00130190 [Umbra pygmaea]|uniref:HEAT repeat-containing protein 6 n=1 Tax=Umbra pygmaea TaxID=75934 RepID=A0ABD0XWD0_UMBPY